MQRALVHHPSGAYTEFAVRDEDQCGINRYDSTTNLYHNTGHSPELVQLLNNNYAHWVLILRETDALLISYCGNNSWVLAYGETVTIIDWVCDVINRAPSSLAQSTVYEYLMYIGGVWPLLDCLCSFKFIPRLSAYEELYSVQTDNGIPYWGCFFPPEACNN